MIGLFYRPDPELKPDLITKLLRLAGGPINTPEDAWENNDGIEEWGEPESAVAKFAPGETVIFPRSLGAGVIIGEPEVFEGGWWYRVRMLGNDKIHQAPESAMTRPDVFDKPGLTTINDWFGIPPEGEQYYRTASEASIQDLIDKYSVIYESLQRKITEFSPDVCAAMAQNGLYHAFKLPAPEAFKIAWALVGAVQAGLTPRPPAPTDEGADMLWPDMLPWGEDEQQYYRTAAEGLIFPKNEWWPKVEPYVNEQAKYFHQCPACGGYMQKRGEDIYECTKCPNSILPERYAAAGRITEVETEPPDVYSDSVWRPGYLFLHSGNLYLGPHGTDHYTLKIPWEYEHGLAGKPLLTPVVKVNYYRDPDHHGAGTTPEGVHISEESMGELPEGMSEWPPPLTTKDITPHLETLRQLHPDVYLHGDLPNGDWGMQKVAADDWDTILNSMPGDADIDTSSIDSDMDIRPQAFIYSPNGGWIRWGGSNSLHEQIETKLHQDGLKIGEDCIYGRWYPQDDRVIIYDARLSDDEKAGVSALIQLNAPRSVPKNG